MFDASVGVAVVMLIVVARMIVVRVAMIRMVMVRMITRLTYRHDMPGEVVAVIV